jgi:hypothetical protein
MAASRMPNDFGPLIKQEPHQIVTPRQYRGPWGGALSDSEGILSPSGILPFPPGPCCEG